MKKLLLGTAPLMAFPFLSLASCGLTIDITSNQINVSAKIVTQQIIDDTINEYTPTLSEGDKIKVLSSVFQGISETNFSKFDVLITTPTTTIPGQITLKAKPGYVFLNGKETLNSWGSGDTGTSDTDLKITPIPSPQSTINKAIESLNNNPPEAEKIKILSTIFNGINNDTIKKFDWEPTGTSPAWNVNLIAKDGYTFAGKKNLSSISFSDPVLPDADLKITPIKSPQSTINQAAESLNNNPSESEQITILSTIFNGINNETFKKFNWQVMGTNPVLSVNLIARDGYTFDGKKILSSVVLGPVVDFRITPIPSIQNVIDSVIEDLLANPNASDFNKISHLSKIFNGVNTTNIKNLTITANRTSGSILGTVVLTAKDGYTINGSKTLTSQRATIIDLEIYSKRPDQTTVVAAQREYDAALTVEKKVAALSKVFNGITVEKFKNISVATVPGTIILTANDGYSFAGKTIITTND